MPFSRAKSVQQLYDKVCDYELVLVPDAPLARALNRRDVEFMLDDFHRVSNPRVMTEDYFDMVFSKYDYLQQEGPKP